MSEHSDDPRQRARDFIEGPAGMAAAPDTETAIEIIRELLESMGQDLILIAKAGELRVHEQEGGYCDNTFSIRAQMFDEIIGEAFGVERSERRAYDFGSHAVLGECELTLRIIPAR